MYTCAEYIWLDGAAPQQLRSKMRVLKFIDPEKCSLSKFPEWGFDGSSTFQAPGQKSDLVLKPAHILHDPFRGEGSYLVMCEVFNADGTPHRTNTRALLRKELDAGASKMDPWIGFEQEYTFFKNGQPMGWPPNGFPKPQGPYYCGVGADKAFGRDIVEAHTAGCLESGIMIYGTNAEVMPGQWEYQIGYRGLDGESADPLTVSDHLWMARWLMHRIAEEFDVCVSLDCKPVKGDWNGAGAHTNFSTKSMRDSKSGWAAITSFVTALSKNHAEHIADYGYGLEERLTGLHETCDINTFKMGERDRGASIRIPDTVAKKKCGYIEDRRPGANCDPYLVSARLCSTLLKSLGKGKEKEGGKKTSMRSQREGMA